MGELFFVVFHLPLKIVQRLNMPKAFSGDRVEGQGAEKVDEENFQYVKELPFAEGFKFPTVAPIIDCSFGLAGQGDNILHSYDILIFDALQYVSGPIRQWDYLFEEYAVIMAVSGQHLCRLSTAEREYCGLVHS